MAKVSPLHRVIDAGQWDSDGLLGRLIIILHAAFLDAGFVHLPRDPRPRRPGPVPRQVGRTASALSLRYTAPQLLHQQDAEAAVLRLLAHGRCLILYVQGDPWPVERCVLVDALATAPLLTGGLDRTARALRSDARMAGLWSRFTDGLCRPAFVDLCRRNGVALEQTFMLLPGDVMGEILGRLTDGADLAMVECLCTEMRRFVAERDSELWMPMYEALGRTSWFPDSSHNSPETSWKEKYMWHLKASRWQLRTSLLGAVPFSFLPGEFESIFPFLRLRYHPPSDHRPLPFFPSRVGVRRMVYRGDPPEPPEDPVTDRKKLRTAASGKGAAGRSHQMPPSCGQEKRRRGAGAIHTHSSRYRWKHR